MTALVIGLIVFLGVHSISIAADPWRNRMAAKLGETRWMGIYTVLSVIGFALIVWGYGIARQSPVVLYTPPTSLRHVAMLLLLFVFPLLFATYLPGRIQTATRHPMLVAVKIWAFAHLLANGTLHDVVLFGSFLAWAVVDRISLKRRHPRPVPGPPPTKVNDIIAVVGGLMVYLWFVFYGHAWLIGVSPM